LATVSAASWGTARRVRRRPRERPEPTPSRAAHARRTRAAHAPLTRRSRAAHAPLTRRSRAARAPLTRRRRRARADSECVPRLIHALRGVRVARLAAGQTHPLVVSEGGEVFSFGDGSHGALGHGNTESCWTPKRIEGLLGVRVRLGAAPVRAPREPAASARARACGAHALVRPDHRCGR
jgi:hypothetical protein